MWGANQIKSLTGFRTDNYPEQAMRELLLHQPTGHCGGVYVALVIHTPREATT